MPRADTARAGADHPPGQGSIICNAIGIDQRRPPGERMLGDDGEDRIHRRVPHAPDVNLARQPHGEPIGPWPSVGGWLDALNATLVASTELPIPPGRQPYPRIGAFREGCCLPAGRR